VGLHRGLNTVSGIDAPLQLLYVHRQVPAAARLWSSSRMNLQHLIAVFFAVTDVRTTDVSWNWIITHIYLSLVTTNKVLIKLACVSLLISLLPELWETVTVELRSHLYWITPVLDHTCIGSHLY